MSAWDEEVDLLVVGSGAAGMTAALVAAEEGLSVLLCEKHAQVGGTTATSGGTLWIPGNSQAARAGIPDPVERGRAYLEREIGNHIRRDLLDAFLESGPRAVDYLEARTELCFDPARGHPDYHWDAPGSAIDGRALVTRPFDGRLLGADFALLRAPRASLMLFGGMMVGRREIPALMRPFASRQNFRHVAAILLRHARDRLAHPRGTRLMLGNALAARLFFSLRQRRVPILLEAPLESLLREAGGPVEGAVIRRGGQPWRVRARRGVVLATGGFPGSRLLRAELMPGIEGLRSYAFEDSRGDGLAMARSVGAAVDEDHAGAAFWTPVSVLRRPDGQEWLWAHHSLDRGRPGVIAVNGAGRRFVNEADSYHDFVEGMLRSHKEVPSIPAWLICDRATLRRYGLGMIKPLWQRLGPWLKAGYLFTGVTLGELAQRIGVEASGLVQTVARHNDLAARGVDEDFGRGARAYNSHLGDPAHPGPNSNLGPIGDGPYFAIALHPGIIGTSIGLRTDADARVTGTDGAPIEGLYACGNDMASVMRGRYPGPGITLGPGVTFAWRAVAHMLGREPGTA
jgi:succinate dehydrogenase/fumarate reductase flavoprotein subunit